MVPSTRRRSLQFDIAEYSSDVRTCPAKTAGLDVLCAIAWLAAGWILMLALIVRARAW
jgi:hypothetical protein